MTNDTAELTLRRSYLLRELAVWRARVASYPNSPLYDDHAFRIELGKMRGELERIDHELGSSNPKPLGTGGKRRVRSTANLDSANLA